MREPTRRSVLLGAASAGVLLASCNHEEEDVAPPEDLMREHGVLNRILLVYEECGHRLDAGTPLLIDSLAKSADIIRRFIEQYHEKLEEDFLFPRFEKANKLVVLVGELRRQHQSGRALTGTIQRLATGASIAKDDDRHSLLVAMRSFEHMYRPHEAREDTVLFPAFRSIVSGREFRELGEQFEDKEHELFGKEGFEGIVRQVDAIEQTLGIFDLKQFTPVNP
jgi:hemerythrin-like domain-containing protein